MSEQIVRLNDIPAAGTDLEDYVAALFQSSGYFVEKSLVERDPADVLELDIVATDYAQTPSVSTIVEAKGGKWGYPDIFKVVGWMRYLNQSHGAFFVKNEEKDIQQVRERMKPLGVDVVCFGDFGNVSEVFSNAGFRSPVDGSVVALWRQSYALERKLGKLLVNAVKSDDAKRGPREALRYHRLVNDGIFFARTRLDSLKLLYDAYKGHPRLTLGCAIEVDGGDFDPYTLESDNPRLREALWSGLHPILQASMYVEHRARLALLRAAVDICAEIDCADDRDTVEREVLGSPEYGALPQSFRAGLSWLRAQSNYRRFALFWQQFLWGWGGFYLTNRADEEFEWMSKYSGLTSAEIRVALSAFDKFFPLPSGWLAIPGDTDAVTVKMVPMTFQGIGVYRRRQQYHLDDKLTGLNGARYTRHDLARWNNCAVEFLLS